VQPAPTADSATLKAFIAEVDRDMLGLSQLPSRAVFLSHDQLAADASTLMPLFEGQTVVVVGPQGDRLVVDIEERTVFARVAHLFGRGRLRIRVERADRDPDVQHHWVQDADTTRVGQLLPS
jgi:hypothetical protein